MSLTVVILTYNEEIHIERCLRSLQPIASKIVVIDSFSTDRTIAIAKSLGAVIEQRAWKNYADQFQWGIDNCGSDSKWIMRMDADEYLEQELQDEILSVVPALNTEVSGIYIKRKVFFYGKWIKHGGFYPHILLRVWRTGLGRIEQRWMDEHIILPPKALTVQLREHMVDENLKGITFWISKHNSYASREVVDLLNNKYSLLDRDDSLKAFDDPQAKRKRLLKDLVYSRLPISLRAFMYFLYRYVLRLGFLDGGKGFLWHFLQGFWYRLLVDIKIMEIEKQSSGNVDKIKQILCDNHGVKL